MPTKVRFAGVNHTQLPQLVSDGIALKGLPQTAGYPDGYGDLAEAVNGLVDLTENVVSVKQFGAKGDGVTDDTVAIQSAIDSGLGGVYFPRGIYIVSAPINIKLLRDVYGQGAELSVIKAKDGTTFDQVIKSESPSGYSYVYLSKLTIDGNKSGGAVVGGILYDDVHVPSYISDVTVIECANYGIRLYDCTVVTLRTVWVNRPESFCLDIDSCRSISVFGGAFEHTTSTAHVKVRNTLGLAYPQCFFHGTHIEGLLQNNTVAFDVGADNASAEAVVGVHVAGVQVLGKNPGGQNGNDIFNLFDTKASLTVTGLSATGASLMARGLPAGYPNSALTMRNVSYWNFNGNAGAAYNCIRTNLATNDNQQVQIVKQYVSGAIGAFGVSSFNVTFPVLPNADYGVLVTPQNYMGNNVGVYVDEATKATTQCTVRFVNTTTGAAAQLANATKFAVTVYRLA
jgi:hypothetical protein